jgi:hypothetical protein
MLDDKHFEGCDATIHNVSKRRTGAPVNKPDREMTKQVDDMRTNTLFHDSGQFWPDTGKNRGGGEQAKDFGWSFRVHGLSLTRRVTSSLQESCAMTKCDDRTKMGSRSGDVTKYPPSMRYDQAKTIALSPNSAILPGRVVPGL